MKNSFREISGSICAPRGFKCASVFCDIKRIGTGKGSEKGKKRDLALIVSDVPAAVAGMFTTNQVCAAPVRVSAKRAGSRSAQAVVVNSGNANACTGRKGMRDAEQMTAVAARALSSWHRHLADEAHGLEARATSAVIDRRYRKISARDVLVCSTGRIGVPMPMRNVERGIRACVPLMARSTTAARQVAEAIMTSDTRRKEIAVEFKIDERTVRIGGTCKGAGMIQPGMTVATGLRPVRTVHRAVAAKHATMLAFITSDVAIESALLKRALEIAVEQSFNRITVDGDMSTNDSVIMLANGLAGNHLIGGARLSRADKSFDGSRGLSPYRQFQDTLNFVTLELAKMIVHDGEGVSRFVTLHIRGARSARDAEAVARAIANSSLVKTSWCGGDPNWGRILCAVGYSKAKVDEAMVDVGYAKPGDRDILFGFRRGQPSNVSLQRLAKITSGKEFDIHVDLNSGRGEFTMYASDLTEDYVAFNKGDVSDSISLGG